jgi:hypothetical protein
MKILVVNPALVRLKALGACEQDRLQNLHDLKRLGHTVMLLTRTSATHSVLESAAYYQQQDIQATVIAHNRQRLSPHRLRDLALLDGAAWPYGAPDFTQTLVDLFAQFKPDLLWCHTSYVWAPAGQAHQYGIPAVIRSVNYEPDQVLHELGRSLANRLRFWLKTYSERRTTNNSAVLAAITPVEQQIYQRLNPQTSVRLLPLRALPRYIKPAPTVIDRSPLHVFFMGASYNVPHNAAALAFIVEQIIPLVRAAQPGAIEFHILGSKAPPQMLALAADDLHFEGYIDDIDTFLAGMDVALAPSLFGVGMQQKVFEPLCRGFPTVTHRQALVGYALNDGEHVLLAEDATTFAQHLLRLREPALRQKLSQNVSKRTAELFSRSALDHTVESILAEAQIRHAN